MEGRPGYRLDGMTHTHAKYVYRKYCFVLFTQSTGMIQHICTTIDTKYFV